MSKEQEIELIKSVIEHPAGFDLDLFLMLKIRSHSDGYEVAWGKAADPKCLEDEYNKDFYRDFKTPLEAATFFVNKRYELELGIDIENQLMKEQK